MWVPARSTHVKRSRSIGGGVICVKPSRRQKSTHGCTWSARTSRLACWSMSARYLDFRAPTADTESVYDTGPRPDLRASDAERERVAAFLRDQAAEGRLDHEELDERVGKAYAAKTVRELQALIADLPRAPFARPRPQPRHYAPARRNGVPPAVVPLGILAFLAFGGPGI